MKSKLKNKIHGKKKTKTNRNSKKKINKHNNNHNETGFKKSYNKNVRINRYKGEGGGRFTESFKIKLKGIIKYLGPSIYHVKLRANSKYNPTIYEFKLLKNQYNFIDSLLKKLKKIFNFVYDEYQIKNIKKKYQMVNNFFDIIFDKSELSTTAKTAYNSLEYTVDHKSTIDNIIYGINELNIEFKKGIDKIVNIFLYNLIYYYGYGTELTQKLLLNKKYTEFEFMNIINENRFDPKLLEERKARINDKRINTEKAQEKADTKFRQYMKKYGVVNRYKTAASNRLHQLELEEKRLKEEEEEPEFGFINNSNPDEIKKLLQYYNNIRKMIFWEYIQSGLGNNMSEKNELDKNQTIRNELEEKIKLLSPETYTTIMEVKEMDDYLLKLKNNIHKYMDLIRARDYLIKLLDSKNDYINVIKKYIFNMYSQLYKVDM